MKRCLRFHRSALFAVVMTLLIGLAFADDKRADRSLGESVDLPIFKVKEDAVSSFGIGLKCFVDSKTHCIRHLIITDIVPGSDADHDNLQVGDEVITMNGRPITELHGEMKKGSELFDLLVSRPAGERLQIEVITKVKRDLTLKAARLRQ